MQTFFTLLIGAFLISSFIFLDFYIQSDLSFIGALKTFFRIKN